MSEESPLDLPLTRKERRLLQQEQEQELALIEPESAQDQPLKQGAERRSSGILSYLFTGLLIGLLALVALVAIFAVAVPSATGARALTVLTSSMEPTLPPGTMIVSKKTPIADIDIGDVLTYQIRSGEPTLVTHRVTRMMTTSDGEQLFITKGDNNPVEDADPVQEVQVVGTLWYAIPWIGWVAVWINGDMRGVILPVLVGALFLYAAVTIVRGLIERNKKPKE